MKGPLSLKIRETGFKLAVKRPATVKRSVIVIGIQPQLEPINKITKGTYHWLILIHAEIHFSNK